MQNPVVVIGGLEKSYMQKLALYLNTRIGKDGYVELLEGSDRQMDLLGSSGKQMELLESSGRQIDSVREDMRLQNVRHQREKHWELAVGSEAFVVALQEAGQAEQILIVGSGLVGMDAAYAFLEQGKEVTVVEMADRILPIQLNETAGTAYRKLFEEHGCRFLLLQ